ncbi:unnamed protein product [Blepharisma stoltei]|uniref:Phospholipase n=1 Tax=Blepharisma stoltei TaxID=1481888 RepID=A0AAU9K111_9CILI|nr:unnamed protein product [Blepharisma stoltei]
MEENKGSVLKVTKDGSITCQIQEYLLTYYTWKNKKFKIFAFILKSSINSKEYIWKINKSYSDFSQTINELQTEKGTRNLNLPHWPKQRHFQRKNDEEKLNICFEMLKAFLAPEFSSSKIIMEFIEVSSKSFEHDKKLKEGFVLKMGGGRVSNQKKLFNCYNCGTRISKRWLRINEDGLEYVHDPFLSNLSDVIPFGKDFAIKSGRKETDYIDGLRIMTPQHNVVFRTGSVFKRDEWVEAIAVAYSQSEYKISQIPNDSSFLVRNHNHVKWYIDGENYYSDVYEALINAKNFVFITDWWLSPDMYLKRPASKYPESQIVEVLGSLADRGVLVYIHIYKEITFTLTLNSLYTKTRLTQRNQNIRIMRHPNVSIKGGSFLWSHHEKMVIVDYKLAFMGGLDLCYGRWDNNLHYLADNGEEKIWNGIDYSNVRIADFTKVENWERDTIDRSTAPRMPWHDIAISVRGRVVGDIASHFRDLWNHSVRDITGSKENSELISLMDTTKLQRIQTKMDIVISKTTESQIVDNEEEQAKQTPSKGKLTIFKGLVSQLFSGESDNPVDNAAFNANILHQQFIKQRERINSTPERMQLVTSMNSPVSRKPGLIEHLGLQNVSIFSKLIQSNLLTPHPRAQRFFSEQDKDEREERERKEELDYEETIVRLRTEITRGSKAFIDVTPKISPQSTETIGSCECQLVRSAGLWSIGMLPAESSIHSAYIHAIYDAQYFIYIENQFFISSTAGSPVINCIAESLTYRIVKAINLNQPFKVIVAIPLLPAFEGSVDDPSASVLRVQLHWEYQTICRGANSIYEHLKKYTKRPKDYIRFYSLRTHSMLDDTPVTEMVYIHSKLMIVDDQVMICGSANINDRSMNGDRDSEIALVIRDSNKVMSVMDGKEFEVGELPHSLRINIFKEHSGCDDPRVLRDPFSDEFREVWKYRAKLNTSYYRNVFRCYPDDRIKKIKKIKSYENRANLEDYHHLVENVKGNLVEFPLKFLEREDLQIKVSNKEYFLPDITFV